MQALPHNPGDQMDLTLRSAGQLRGNPGAQKNQSSAEPVFALQNLKRSYCKQDIGHTASLATIPLQNLKSFIKHPKRKYQKYLTEITLGFC